MDSAKVVKSAKYIENILKLLALLQLTKYHYPHPAQVKNNSTFDFVISGGGTAGCLIANRLIETGKATVLIIEAGGIPPFESEVPALFPFMKQTKYDWNFTSSCNVVKNKHQKRGAIHYSQGKMLGGSGSFTYLSYSHGQPGNFNQWAEITNDSSWSWDSVLPLIKRSEQLQDKKVLNSSASRYYGKDGKIEIHKQYYRRNLYFFEAFKELGYDSFLDINPDHPIGFQNTMFNIGDNIRQNTPLKYLGPIKRNPNLYVMYNSLATKVLFDENKNAVAVEVLTENNTLITVRAKQEIIVTAGVFKSPQLLMLSGIGPKHHLQNKDIKVIADLPVGKNFQDHINSLMLFRMTKANKTPTIEDPHKYPFSILQGECALNKSQTIPDYEVIGAHFASAEQFLDLCAFYFTYDDSFCDSLAKDTDNKELFLAFVTYFNPKSRGEVLLASKDPRDKPLIITGYYTKDIDVDNHAKYVADLHRVVNTKYFKSVDAVWFQPNLTECNKYKLLSHDYWRCYVVATGVTSNYVVGTCAMGRRGSGVLDSRLRVWEVNRLRVADASIMPLNVHSETFANVLMIAQKASDMIIEDCNLK